MRGNITGTEFQRTLNHLSMITFEVSVDLQEDVDERDIITLMSSQLGSVLPLEVVELAEE